MDEFANVALSDVFDKLLRKENIDMNTYGQSKGRDGSYSTNWQDENLRLQMKYVCWITATHFYLSGESGPLWSLNMTS